jgi:predicted AAA+ superfamily ATPase
VTDETYETYSNWIFGDAHRFKLSRETLIHILFRIFDTIASQVTWQRLIETSPIKRHETAFAYVEHLDLAFLCKILDCYEPQKDMAAPRKAKKIYFIDPLIYVVAGGYLRGIRNCYKWWLNSLADNNFMGKIFESIVVNHYARRFDSIYYWYSSNLKREIDMLIRKENEILLYDIKLQSQEIKPALGKRVEVISPSDFNP